MRSFCTLWLLLSLLTCGHVWAQAPSSALVYTPLGPIQGTTRSLYRQFLGIPYAEPPTKYLRFRPAVPKSSWGSRVLDATSYGPACPQLDKAMYYSEDCLYLNIWTPRGAPYVPFPVLVWIHGGAFSVGSGSEYNGSQIASRQGLVVVTINYRLGPLGFLAHPGLTKEDPSSSATGGLNGINDQLVALQWVRAHISAFWGDPHRVTIAGESAGSISVCDLVVSPRASGLFQRAIMESGSCVGPWGPFPAERGFEMSAAFMKSIGTTSLSKLRSLSMHQLMNSSLWTQIAPSVDGWVLREFPLAPYSRGTLAVPHGSELILGTTTLDSLDAPPYVWQDYPNNETEYQRLLSIYFSKQAKAVVSLYSDVHPNISIRYKIMNADVCNVCPARSLAKLLTRHDHPVYVYQYAYNPDQAYHNLAFHGSEVPLLFGAPMDPLHHFLFPFDGSLSAIMQQYWGSFARQGQPWGSETWSKWDQRESYVRLTTPHPTSHSGYATKRCTFWADNFQSSELQLQLLRFCWQRPLLSGKEG